MLGVIVKESLSDSIVSWHPYVSSDVVRDNFQFEEWNKIVGDINSDKEWAIFLKKTAYVKCFMLRNCLDNVSIAFLYVMQEDDKGEVISVHGGGWESPLKYYRGYILMLKHLLCLGFKVRTYCRLSNLAAIRFDRSVGFVPYRYTEDEVFMWISRKRLEDSKLYKRFYK